MQSYTKAYLSDRTHSTRVQEPLGMTPEELLDWYQEQPESFRRTQRKRIRYLNTLVLSCVLREAVDEGVRPARPNQTELSTREFLDRDFRDRRREIEDSWDRLFRQASRVATFPSIKGA